MARQRRVSGLFAQAREVVLVVDDNHDVAASLAAALREDGYDVALASDGEQALRIACSRHVDLVLTDVVMPGVDGIELIRLMRQDPFLRETRIVAFSMYPAHCAEAREAGANACEQKPMCPEGLAALVRRYLPPKPHLPIRTALRFRHAH